MALVPGLGVAAGRGGAGGPAFPADHSSEHAAIGEIADRVGDRSASCTHFAEGGKGAAERTAIRLRMAARARSETVIRLRMAQR
ncbi:MAG: hypothetical protein WCC65_13395 [Pseudonocardiaceae bacterium]